MVATAKVRFFCHMTKLSHQLAENYMQILRSRKTYCFCFVSLKYLIYIYLYRNNNGNTLKQKETKRNKKKQKETIFPPIVSR